MNHPDAGKPALIIIRGNSGSGKTSLAQHVQTQYGRGCALLEQDQLRRVILREHDTDDTDVVAPAFITATAAEALRNGYHVVLEGMMIAVRYRSALHQLIAHHPGPTSVFYLDIPLDETLRRNASRMTTAGFTATNMRDWYTPNDQLGVAGEHIIGGSTTLEQNVSHVLNVSGLLATPPLTPCPTRCPRCQGKAATPSGQTARSNPAR